MEVETKAPVSYRFEFSDGEVIGISDQVVSHLITLKTQIEDLPDDERTNILLLDPSSPVTGPIMKWVIDAYMLALAREEKEGKISNLEHLYVGVKEYNKIASIKGQPPVLAFLDNTDYVPGEEKFELLCSLVVALDWLEADLLLKITLLKVYQIVDEMSTIYLEVFVRSLKKRKPEDATQELPLTPLYKREQLINDYLSAKLVYTLVRANRAIHKYINPIAIGNALRFYFTTACGLLIKPLGNDSFIPKGPGGESPLLLVAQQDFVLSLRNDGLYGLHNGTTSGELGLPRDDKHSGQWHRLSVEGEVLLISSGLEHTVILTDKGLFASGDNRHGQLGNDKTMVRLHKFSRVKKAYSLGTVIDVQCGPNHTFVLTSSGLYACGSNSSRQLGVGVSDITVLKLMPVLGLTGRVLSFSAGAKHTLILTTDGLYAIGCPEFGSLGIGGPIVGFVRDAQKVLLTNVVGSLLTVYAFNGYSILQTTEGLYATGRNRYGQLAIGSLDSVSVFTKMIGYEGEVKSVSANDTSVIILTTKGLYLSGQPPGLPFEEETRDIRLYLQKFKKLKLDMGYFSPVLTLPEEGESQEKKRKVSCYHCGGEALFYGKKQSSFFCGKYCKLLAQQNSPHHK